MCIMQSSTFGHRIHSGSGMRPAAFHSPLPASPIHTFSTTLTGPTATCFSFTRPEVRRIAGRMEWPNSYRLDRISYFGVVFAKQLPAQRVLTLQLTNDHFAIPPETDDYRAEAWGTLPNDATLLSFLPHMHLRGKRFDYNIIHDNGNIETLLRVNYDFYWQLSYRLAEPRLLKAGTKLQAVAWYDNSNKNPHNPDPHTTVTWGDQTYDEMMVGFFDIALSRTIDKKQYFVR